MDRIINKAASLLERQPDLTHEDLHLFELSRRILWLLVLRLLVSLILIVAGIGKPFLIPHLNIESWVFFLVAAVLIVLDLFYWLHYRNAVVSGGSYGEYSRKIFNNVHIQIILDFAVLTYLVYVFGSAESPLIYFYLFHVSISCIFFKRKISFIYTLLCIFLIIAVCVLTHGEILPPTHFMKDSSHHWHAAPCVYYYMVGVCAVYFVCWYLVSSITESLRRTEHELQHKIEEMVEVDREKTHYMLTTTHELKAPFTAIQSYINVILDGFVGPVNSRVSEILERMKTRCQRLLAMINDMLQLANIKGVLERGAELEPADVSQIISSVLSSLAGPIGQKCLRVSRVGMGRGPFWIMGLKDKLEILFTNIISNAICYSHPNSAIEIYYDERDDKRIVVVADHGIGIKKENIEKVFLEFFRSEAAVGMNKNSTGLGLTISRNIMNLHKGRIWIESEVEKGTKVFMEFDRAEGF